MGSGPGPANRRELGTGDFATSIETVLSGRNRLERVIGRAPQNAWINWQSEQVVRTDWQTSSENKLIRSVSINREAAGRLWVVQTGMVGGRLRDGEWVAEVIPGSVTYIQTNTPDGARFFRREIWFKPDGSIAMKNSTIAIDASGKEVEVASYLIEPSVLNDWIHRTFIEVEPRLTYIGQDAVRKPRRKYGLLGRRRTRTGH